MLVRKVSRFSIDYHKLNSVTKADTFSLTRIDDLLDQLANRTISQLLTLLLSFGRLQYTQLHKKDCLRYISGIL